MQRSLRFAGGPLDVAQGKLRPPLHELGGLAQDVFTLGLLVPT
jgi:hypothetical protein